MTLTPGQNFFYIPPPLPAFLMPEMPSYPVTSHQITTSIHHHRDYDYPGVTERKKVAFYRTRWGDLGPKLSTPKAADHV